MKLILVRHGETEENVKGVIQGHMPGTLSGNGVAQVEKTALALKDEAIDAIHASDLKRAADTARAIHRHHETAPLEFTEALRERNLGAFQGKTREQVKLDPFLRLSSSLDEIEGGESMADFMNRAARFVDDVLSKHADHTVLLVSHNGTIKAMLAHLLGKQVREVGSQGNACINVLEVSAGECTVVKLNDTGHLG